MYLIRNRKRNRLGSGYRGLFQLDVLCETWWRNGSASASRAEGCVFKSRPGQIFFLVYFVLLFDIWDIVIKIKMNNLLWTVIQYSCNPKNYRKNQGFIKSMVILLISHLFKLPFLISFTFSYFKITCFINI